MSTPKSKKKSHRQQWLETRDGQYELARMYLMGEIVACFNQGWSIEDIAEVLGRPKKFVRKMLQEARENAVVSD